MIKKFKPPANFGGGHRYVMHTDDPTIRKDNKAKLNPEGEGWVEKREHPEGVTEHIHEYGSSLYVTHATSRREAQHRIAKAEARTNQVNKEEVEKRYGETLFEKPGFAFEPSITGQRGKPTIIKGGKDD